MSLQRTIAIEAHECYGIRYYIEDGRYGAIIESPENVICYELTRQTFEEVQRDAVATIDRLIEETPDLATQLAAAQERIKELEAAMEAPKMHLFRELKNEQAKYFGEYGRAQRLTAQVGKLEAAIDTAIHGIKSCVGRIENPDSAQGNGDPLFDLGEIEDYLTAALGK
jgi:hypothetical protein